MGRKLYVGNLPFSATEDDLVEKFPPFGRVESAKLITDRETGRSKGFGFVEMSSDSEAQAAIDKLNGAVYSGRPMPVHEARPATPGTGGGGRGGYGGNRWETGGRRPARHPFRPPVRAAKVALRGPGRRADPFQAACRGAR